MPALQLTEALRESFFSVRCFFLDSDPAGSLYKYAVWNVDLSRSPRVEQTGLYRGMLRYAYPLFGLLSMNGNH